MENQQDTELIINNITESVVNGVLHNCDLSMLYAVGRDIRSRFLNTAQKEQIKTKAQLQLCEEFGCDLDNLDTYVNLYVLEKAHSDALLAKRFNDAANIRKQISDIKNNLMSSDLVIVANYDYTDYVEQVNIDPEKEQEVIQISDSVEKVLSNKTDIKRKKVPLIPEKKKEIEIDWSEHESWD